MVRERSLFEGLAREWECLAAHPSSGVHLRRWHLLAGCFDGYLSVGEVVASFDDHSEKDRSARLLNGLLVAAADDRLARRALLQALTAGLKRATRSLYRRISLLRGEVDLPWTTRAELEADAIAELLAQIDAASGRALGHPAATLLARVRARLWRAVYSSADAPQLTFDVDRWMAPRSLLERNELDTLLIDAVTDGSVMRDDAALIWRYRVRDEPLGVIAASIGCSEARVQKRRERAELRLIAAHRNPSPTDTPRSPR